MCGLAAAGLVIGIMAASGTAYQQNESQRSTIKYQNQVTDATQASAAKAAQSDYVAMIERTQQVRQSAALEAFAAGRQAQGARGSLAAGAAHAGLQGGSVDDLRYTIAIQASQDAAVRQRNLDWQDVQISRSIDKITAEQTSRVNSRNLPQVPGLDYVGLLGSLGGSYLNFGSQVDRMNA